VRSDEELLAELKAVHGERWNQFNEAERAFLLAIERVQEGVRCKRRTPVIDFTKYLQKAPRH
jgi:hypothetical protein